MEIETKTVWCYVCCTVAFHIDGKCQWCIKLAEYFIIFPKEEKK